MNECIICLDTFSENEIYKFCNNKHIYCKNCMNNYLKSISEKKEVKCPCCRNIIKIKDDD